MLLMNGDKPFSHPVTGVLVGPYQWYEGYGHQEHENVEETPIETVEEPKKRSKKEGA